MEIFVIILATVVAFILSYVIAIIIIESMKLLGFVSRKKTTWPMQKLKGVDYKGIKSASEIESLEAFKELRLSLMERMESTGAWLLLPEKEGFIPIGEKFKVYLGLQLRKKWIWFYYTEESSL